MSTRKTALITGANKGIGREIARQLGHRGYTVWLGCRDAERGEQAAAALREEGLHANVLTLDVTDDALFALDLGLRNAPPLLRRRMSALLRDDGPTEGSPQV